MRILKWSAFWITVGSLIELVNPYLVREMLEWIGKDRPEALEGILYALGLGLVTAMKIYCFRRGSFDIALNQIYSNSILYNAIMKKVIKMRSSILGVVELGSITSLFTLDSSQLYFFNWFFNVMIVVPVMLICITAILVLEFGYICLFTPFLFMGLVMLQMRASLWSFKNVFGKRSKIYDRLGTYLS